DASSTDIYTPSLHDALPICIEGDGPAFRRLAKGTGLVEGQIVGADAPGRPALGNAIPALRGGSPQIVRVVDHGDQYGTPLQMWRSEEHTSELQSRENIVCRL